MEDHDVGAGGCLSDEGGDLVDDVAGDEVRPVSGHECCRAVEAVAALRVFGPHERLEPGELIRVRYVDRVQVDARAPCDFGEACSAVREAVTRSSQFRKKALDLLEGLDGANALLALVEKRLV
ncbi:hypothetical protein [Microbacterium sp. Gd 4-13]|uniref:hypothetical protein n=1 Tax=Microbacterium sp. Gd 4-13 TaxID=2173179 RepID=UPI00140301DA|nr:hypothetical protein [Microbacterium sp. Gd 4-13]